MTFINIFVYTIGIVGTSSRRIVANRCFDKLSMTMIGCTSKKIIAVLQLPIQDGNCILKLIIYRQLLHVIVNANVFGKRKRQRRTMEL